jgi:LacI family transcriptional regulator
MDNHILNRATIKTRERPLVVLSTREPRTFPAAAGHAIAEQAREFGWDLLDLRFTRGSLPDDREPSGALIESLPTEPLARRLRKMGCPTVRLGQLAHPNDEILPAVLPDGVATGHLAAEHFAEREFRNVAYVGRRPWSLSRTMYEAFRDRAEALGCTSHLLRVGGEKSMTETAKYELRARQVGQWLTGLPKPVGVLSFSDSQAATLCTMCRRSGLAVPEDVAVLGLGNDLLDCEMSPVALSSIDVARDEWGRQAAQLLQRLMHGEPEPGAPIMIPPRGIVARRSTDVLAVADPAVAQAMRFMWDNLDQNLSVVHVAEAVDVPRRKLERAFRQHLKRGINAELRRKRLERCCELLRGTDITITDLAPMVGFRSGDYLHASFKQAFGITPRKYRVGQRE